MTLEQIIYDVKLILRATTDDTRISDAHLLRIALNYRHLFIIDSFLQTGEINPQWVQRLGNKPTTSVGSADNPAIPEGTIKLGKITLPNMISVGPQKGIYRLSDTQRQKQIYDTTWPVLMHMIAAEDSRLRLFKYYCRIGNECFIYPFVNDVDLMAVLDNPFDGIAFNTEMVSLTNLEIGTEYLVVSGSVKQILDGTPTIYPKNSAFVCLNEALYSGDGKVRLADQVMSEISNKDFYIDSAIAQRIVLEILTKDFAIERQSVSDIVNDSADQTKILTSK